MSEDKKDMQDIKFDLSQIEKTFTRYKLNEIVDAVVVIKQENGVVVNIGGKLDAFIPKEDFENYGLIKFGDRFKVAITNMKNADGMIEASKTKADVFMTDNLQASTLKIGKTFSFVPLEIRQNSIISKLGHYEIVVPQEHLQNKRNLKNYLNKRLEVVVVDLNEELGIITASETMLNERIKQNLELSFWNSVFVNKLVNGTVIKDLGYGVLVNVNGVVCFCHISQVAHNRIEKITEVLQIGKKYTFRIIEVDKENQKVALSYKALQKNEKQKALEGLAVGQEFNSKVKKLLDFGAILEIENNVNGLLHISDASLVYGTFIRDIVKLGEELEVRIKNIDHEKERISFELIQKR